jgi:hypothetical protein
MLIPRKETHEAERALSGEKMKGQQKTTPAKPGASRRRLAGVVLSIE